MVAGHQGERSFEQYLKSEDGKVFRDSLDQFTHFSQTVVIFVEERVIK
jgi:hypothetical protein